MTRSWTRSVCVLRPLLAAATVALLMLAVPSAGLAQSTSVEELERRLQKAKEDKARRDAAAAAAAAKADADRKAQAAAQEAERRRQEAEAARAAADRKAQEARMANLVVQADAPCTLFVNGREAAQLPKGITEVKVAPGQSLVSCTSSEERAAVFEGELEAKSGQNSVLRISLAGRVSEFQRSRAAAKEREAQARREAEAGARAAAEAKPACDRGERSAMQPGSASGVLRQCGTDLEWTAQGMPADPLDNGMTWREAQSHCRRLGGGWSLPTVEQLQSLYNANLPAIRCGPFTCKVSNQFRLSSFAFWSSEPNGSSEAWKVALDGGGRFTYPVHIGGNALCVRRP